MPYFTYSIDNLSHIIPGAMCAAGVIKANNGDAKIVLCSGNKLIIKNIVI